jgi:hypothetical protein
MNDDINTDDINLIRRALAHYHTTLVHDQADGWPGGGDEIDLLEALNYKLNFIS